MAARTHPAEALRSNARTTAHGASFLQRSLVVLQASLSLVLLVAAGLFAQSLNKAENVDMKLDATNRYIAHINPQAAGYKVTEVEPLYQTIVDRFHAIPGVLQVGLSTNTPMEENNWGTGVKVQGEPDLNKGASVVKGSSEYFDSVGTRVVMGRGFRPQDTLNAAPVAVVNQEFVKQFFGKRNPIGHSFGPSGPGQAGRDGAHEIVGVVEDTTYTSIYWKNHAMYFLPLTQRSGSANDPDYHLDKDQSMYAGALVIQTGHPIAGFEKTVSETLASINPNLTIVKFQTFRQQIDDRFIQERLIARLTSLFACCPAARRHRPLCVTAIPCAPHAGDRHSHALSGAQPRHRTVMARHAAGRCRPRDQHPSIFCATNRSSLSPAQFLMHRHYAYYAASSSSPARLHHPTPAHYVQLK